MIWGGVSGVSFGGRAGWRRRMGRFSVPGMLPARSMYGPFSVP